MILIIKWFKHQNADGFYRTIQWPEDCILMNPEMLIGLSEGRHPEVSMSSANWPIAKYCLTPEKQNTEKIHEKMWCLKFRVRFMPPLFAYQSKNSNRVSILSYPPMYQHQAIQLPPVKPGSTSSFLDLSCGVAKQKSKKKQVKMAAWHPSRQQFFPGLLQVSQLRLGPWRTLSACCLQVHYFGIPETHLLVDTCWSTL